MSENKGTKYQVVYEEQEYLDEHSGPYGSSKVGLRIDDRVIWFESYAWPSSIEAKRRYECMVSELNHIVEALEFYENQRVKQWENT